MSLMGAPGSKSLKTYEKGGFDINILNTRPQYRERNRFDYRQKVIDTAQLLLPMM